jgi:hypothetical protein
MLDLGLHTGLELSWFFNVDLIIGPEKMCFDSVERQLILLLEIDLEFSFFFSLVVDDFNKLLVFLI